MRVSTTMIQSQGAAAIGKNQSELLRTQQMLSSGRKLLTPADDPLGASRAAQIEDLRRANERFQSNQTAAKNDLGFAESTLGDIENVLQDVREAIVKGGNGVLNDQDRAAIAREMRASYANLLSLSNSRDASGKFLFAGYSENTQPFADSPVGAVYNGDQGRREIQISPSRSIPVSQNGAELFERIRTGNGIFSTAAAIANTGTGISDRGAVISPASVNGDAYRVQFSVVAGVVTYDVIDTTTATILSAGNAYTEGASIGFGGMQLSISGAPMNGDAFDIAPSQNQSVFRTIGDTIDALERPTVNDAGSARLANDLASSIANIDQASENIIIARAGMGASLREIDSVADISSGNDIRYQSDLSQIRDLDYAKSISDFTRQQQSLQAAQQSYARIMRLSLFDVIG